MSAADRVDEWYLDDELPEPDESGQVPALAIGDESLANDTIRRLAYWYAEREHIQLQALQERAKINERELRLLERVEKRIAWYEGGCAAFLDRLGKRAWAGIQGRISWHKGRQSVQVVDEAAFWRWANTLDEETHDQLVKTTVAPSKSGIAAHIKDTGELPAGVDVQTSPDTLVVTPA